MTERLNRADSDSTESVLGASPGWDQDNNFRLAEPTRRFCQHESGSRPPVAKSSKYALDAESAYGKVEYRAMGWRGIDDQPEIDSDPRIRFVGNTKERQEMDMTPMVDVTFLLLIFFMVTASFVFQRSVAQPTASVDLPGQPIKLDDEEPYVEVIIDQTNTFYVTTPDSEEIEAPSSREMQARVRDAKMNSSAKRLIITAHVDSMHDRVVAAWDVGTIVGMNEIEVRTTDSEY